MVENCVIKATFLYARNLFIMIPQVINNNKKITRNIRRRRNKY